MSEFYSSLVKRHSKCRRLVSMKRRARLDVRKRGSNLFRRKLTTLKKLIPNREAIGGLDGLFRETAEYIMCLQMRVKVMRIMVNVLTGSDE
ncbi:stachyose synthase family protein [Hibiscus syriacus]|uniref:Stachyose synthase family protein n=1 Tax=Hibiscus syriacus TaxID=106335 RepID=A0A6A3A766_HIBSY|nr:stachyose synthase family protein [Hibiscus syriacus]